MEALLNSALILGFGLGLLHALDPDHLVAMSTIASREHRMGRSSALGVLWGLGHTASLTLVGMVVILMQITIPPALSKGMELVVALMIVLLGVHLVWQWARERVVHRHVHAHGGPAHTHLHVHGRDSLAVHDHHAPRSGKKAFAIGVIHGLAGSAALSLAVLATMTTPVEGILYIVIFGVGSIGGMLLMSALMSLPFALIAQRLSAWEKPAQAVVGAGAVAFGLYFAWSVGVAP